MSRRHLAAFAAAAVACGVLAASAPAQPAGGRGGGGAGGREGGRAGGRAPVSQLQGTFQMSGTVTVARNVRGEQPGQIVRRTWTFTPLCGAGPCANVTLVRSRPGGTDTVELTSTGPATYLGSGRFYAPMRCAGRRYLLGQAIPFQITVHVRASAPGPTGVPVATRITARYMNRSRLNLTPCVAVLGHDAARYTGAPVSG